MLESTILFPTFVITLAFFVIIGMPAIGSGSLNGSMGNDIPNATSPQVNTNIEDDGQDRKEQSCQMPPCPPGEMCIQVCPESVPP
jgi:hypothetical protein